MRIRIEEKFDSFYKKLEQEALKEAFDDNAVTIMNAPTPNIRINPVAIKVNSDEEEPNIGIMGQIEEVMTAYQNANKWLDITKEIVYSNLNCVFFSSFIHKLAHTMPERFDKFGDILHTCNIRVPYPPTAYIPNEPTNIEEAFDVIFMCLEQIKIALDSFILAADVPYHGMACAAEGLLNDIESEYPMLYRMQKQWQACEGDIVAFDKYVGQYVEHKDELLA